MMMQGPQRQGPQGYVMGCQDTTTVTFDDALQGRRDNPCGRAHNPCGCVGMSGGVPMTMGLQFGAYVPTWAIAALGGLGLVGAMMSKTKQARFVSLSAGLGLAAAAVGYNTLRQQREIDQVIAEGGVVGGPPPI